MSIWKRALEPGPLSERSPNCLPAAFGIVITEVGPDYLLAEMPVDERHIQPFGILHGGASVVLAETLGSLASTLTAPEGVGVVGLEVNANHIAAVRKGETVGQLPPAAYRPHHPGLADRNPPRRWSGRAPVFPA